MWSGPMDGPISGIFLGIANAIYAALPPPLNFVAYLPFGSAALIGAAGS